MRTTETTFERDGLKVEMKATKYVGQMIEYKATVTLDGVIQPGHQIDRAVTGYIIDHTWRDKTVSAARAYFDIII